MGKLEYADAVLLLVRRIYNLLDQDQQSPALPCPDSERTPEVAGAPEGGGSGPETALPAPTVEEQPGGDSPVLDKITQAIALKQKHPDWTAKRIAGVVGCAPANLSQSPRWKMVNRAIKGVGQQASRREGEDRRAKARGGRHRGTDMDQYADNRAGQPKLTPVLGCASCGDGADTDADGKPLVFDGKPCCRECWDELNST
jgi:hypothetical protein